MTLKALVEGVQQLQQSLLVQQKSSVSIVINIYFIFIFLIESYRVFGYVFINTNNNNIANKLLRRKPHTLGWSLFLTLKIFNSHPLIFFIIIKMLNLHHYI